MFNNNFFIATFYAKQDTILLFASLTISMPKKTLQSSQLAEAGLIKPQDKEAISQAINAFSFKITPAMQALMTNADDVIGKQFIPSVNELNISPSEHQDPIGDQAFTKVKGIIHRYPDRCLFTPVHVCAVYCRFCFRKETIGTNADTLSAAELSQAIHYIETHTEIWEVILTGGDPLILKPQQLAKLIEKLTAIPHVAVIRIHTRIPIVDPHRINDAMVAALKNTKPVYVVVHANHAREIGAAAVMACARLVDAGIPLLSQTTLLKDINDNLPALSELMRTFVKNRIKPYYLHHADLVKGTAHFRTSVAKGRALIKGLRGQFSGLCQPTYVIDIPGGYGKVPIGPAYINEVKSYYELTDYQGMVHRYDE